MNQAQSGKHTTYLERVLLDNFRLFERIEVDLHQQLTVLVAPNSGGKTSLLDAMALSLRYFVDNARGASTSHGFDASDIRVVRAESGGMVQAGAVRLTAVGTIDDRRTTWQRELGTPGGKTTYVDAKELLDRAAGLRRELADFASGRRATPPELPVVAYYGTGRLWRELKTTELKKLSAENLAMNTGGYVDCLEPSSSFGQFSVWFERIVREAQDERESNVESVHKPNTRLAAVRRAIDSVLAPTGWSQLNWSFVTAEMVMNHEEFGRLPFKLLSDGIRAMLSLVGDLAHRCVRLNPHFGEDAAKKTPGIVLIDEVDMHLHPAWQQTVIGSLQAAFPRVQFIVTTHSPQVLSTVPSECIRILDVHDGNGRATQPSRTPYGHASSVALEAIQGVGAYPPTPLLGKLLEYQGLVDQDRHDSARALELRQELEQAWGAADPEVLRLDVGIRKNEVLRKLGRKGAQ